MSFSADLPIKAREDDRLGRWGFAAALAEALGRWKTSESIVVALFGAWGSGKTSVKNLAVTALKRTHPSCSVMHFSPWLVSGQDKLVETFFHDLAAILGRTSSQETAEKASQRLSALAPYLKTLGAFTENASNLLEIAGVPWASFGARFGKAVKKAGDSVKEGADAQKQLAEAAVETLAELKEHLREATQTLPGTLVVVIDDIDRLTSDEVCLLFRLIKANADLPNLIYLILCDRPVVIEALETIAPKRGAEFLEKIVQVSFDIPNPTGEHLMALALAEWNSILKTNRDAARRATDVRWSELIKIAEPYLAHVRSVRRWMNGVGFLFRFFCRKAGFDANPEDILGIELLRVSEPKLYQEIARRKRDLTKGYWDFLGWDDDANKKMERRTALLLHANNATRDAAGAILDWLFPNARWSQHKSDESTFLKDLRVGHSACFDRYFRFNIGHETLGRHEIIKALKAVAVYSECVTLFRRMLMKGKLSMLLSHLEAHAVDLIGSAKSIIQACFDIGDELPNRRWHSGGEGLQAEMLGLCTSVLARITPQSARAEILINATRASKGVMLPVLICCDDTHETRRSRFVEDSLLVGNDQIRVFQDAAVAKLIEFKDQPALCDAQSFGLPITLWKLWAGTAGPTQWLSERIHNSEFVWKVLRSAAGTESSATETRFIGVDVKWLSELLTVEKLKEILSTLPEEPENTDRGALRRLFVTGLLKLEKT